MLKQLIRKYSHYNIRYYPPKKILFIQKPMLVKDYVNLKNIIKKYKLEVNDIRIGGIK